MRRRRSRGWSSVDNQCRAQTSCAANVSSRCAPSRNSASSYRPPCAHPKAARRRAVGLLLYCATGAVLCGGGTQIAVGPRSTTTPAAVADSSETTDPARARDAFGAGDRLAVNRRSGTPPWRPSVEKAAEGEEQSDLTELVKAAVAEAMTPIKAQLGAQELQQRRDPAGARASYRGDRYRRSTRLAASGRR
jgi:hypothetical protein